VPTNAPGPGTPVPGAPTVTPGAPTVSPGETGGPPTPPGTERRIVESTLEYGFFAGTQVRQPTEEEYNGLMAETTRFYTDVMKAAYPNLESFVAFRVDDEFRPANTDLPIFVDFDAYAFFQEGTTIPTEEEVFATLQAADYESK